MRGGVPSEMTSTCVQGGIRPLGGYQPNIVMEPSSPASASAWQYHSVFPKQEPMDAEERNDSGLASSSDFISSSPGSDQSEQFSISYSTPTTGHTVSTTPNTTHLRTQMSTSAHTITQMSAHNPFYSNLMMRHPEQGLQNLVPHSGDPASGNSTTDPGPSPMRRVNDEVEQQATFNRCPSPEETLPSTSETNRNEDALKRLQASLEKNGLLHPSTSPKPSEGSDDNKSDNDPDEYDDQGVRVPKVNSHGKIKTFKCKSCDYVAVTKLCFWEHSRIHIKDEKILTCPKCPFVTEYKHHLEYHLRNHFGSKPFKCSQCNYSCVNKSMLNSHLKSHSNIYQYRCSDCSYATKYCHSLKLHLRKYAHKPAMVLNADGTPNPLPIIDVYGTRRGPKIKCHQQESKPAEDNTAKPDSLLPFALNQFMPQLPFPGFSFFPGFPAAIPNPLLFQNLQKLARERQESVHSPEQYSSEATEGDDAGALDLSKPEEPSKNRRKGAAYKISSNGEQSSDEDDDDEDTTTMFGNVEVVETKHSDALSEKEEASKKDAYRCQYCDINFGEPILYTMHMGYHGYNNPFTCNMCGEECKDKVSFFIHIARIPHS